MPAPQHLSPRHCVAQHVPPQATFGALHEVALEPVAAAAPEPAVVPCDPVHAANDTAIAVAATHASRREPPSVMLPIVIDQETRASKTPPGAHRCSIQANT